MPSSLPRLHPQAENAPNLKISYGKASHFNSLCYTPPSSPLFQSHCPPHAAGQPLLEFISLITRLRLTLQVAGY